MVEQPGNGWVGHSVTRVKCNEMRSLELFNAGGTADNISLFAPGCILHPGAFLRGMADNCLAKKQRGMLDFMI